jgi:hypothetical protein
MNINFVWMVNGNTILNSLVRNNSANQMFNFHIIFLQKNILNDVGTKNNLVSVRRSDFEVFEGETNTT